MAERVTELETEGSEGKRSDYLPEERVRIHNVGPEDDADEDGNRLVYMVVHRKPNGNHSNFEMFRELIANR